MNLVVVCPSKNRPAQAVALAESFASTTGASSHLIVVVDQGQERAYQLLANVERTLLFSCGHPGPAPAIASAVRGAEADLFSVVPDDARFLTPGWDKAALSASAKVPGGLGIVNPYSVYGGRIEMPMVTRRFVEAIGSPVPLNVYHFCWNTCLAMLATALGPSAVVQLREDECSISHASLPSENRYHLDADCVQFHNWACTDFQTQVAALRAAAA